MTIIAIDPGANGGIAVLESGSCYALAMPATDGDIEDTIGCLASRANYESWGCVAVVEDMVKYTGKNCPASAIAVYARNHGFIEGVLMAHGVRIERVRAQSWQKDLGLGVSTGKSKTQWKNHLKSMAQRLYPQLNGQITLKTADALLILEWANREFAKRKAIGQ